MQFSLNGAKPLTQQAVMLRGSENTGKELLSIAPDLDFPTFNNAVLRVLDMSAPTPSPLDLTTGPLPHGKRMVWMGVIYAEGRLTPAIAFRAGSPAH